MKKLLFNGLAAIALATTTMTAIVPTVEAAFTTAVVSDSGLLQGGRDHYFEITVEGDPLQRVRVECITFHELDGLEILVNGEAVSPEVHYGFEEFTLTFAEEIAASDVIRIVMENSRVRGSINAGIDVPYRVYGTYASLNNSEVPLGTAVIRTRGRGDN
ncbi:MAG: hypothetical protein AAGE59_21840 [Cyanobacteria bacterium P01_F01_bin.86]